MNEEQNFWLSPVIDRNGNWGGIWLHGSSVTADTAESLQMAIPNLKIYLTGDIAVATGIQSLEQLSTATANGHVVFAGPYVAHPPITTATKQDAGRIVLLRLLALLAQDADTTEIEQVFKREPGLSYHLFRLINSAGMGLNREISTFNQAIMMLGRRQMQRWIQLLLYANKNEKAASPLLHFAAMRGNLLEQLAVAQGCDAVTREQAFMTGIFSLLDSLLGMSMAEIGKNIQLPDPVRLALLEHRGELGEWLSWVEDVQAGVVPSRSPDIAAEQCAKLQLEALIWAQDVGASMA